MGKISSFLSLTVNIYYISKTVGDTVKVTIRLMTNMKSHVGFPLTPRSMTLDDLELHKFEFLVNFAGFRRYLLDGTDVCCNLSHRPIIALFSCFDKKNKYN